jgi:hypothetical protein
MSVDAKRLRAAMGAHMLNHHARLYALTGNRAHAWLAWRDARRMHVPPPRWLMEALDRIAADVVIAGSQRAAAAAVGFAGRGPGPMGQARTWGRDVYLHKAVWELLERGEAVEAAICQVAVDRRLSESTVRRAHGRVDGAVQQYRRDSGVTSQER